jgi:hypothetical protein
MEESGGSVLWYDFCICIRGVKDDSAGSRGQAAQEMYTCIYVMMYTHNTHIYAHTHTHTHIPMSTYTNTSHTHTHTHTII